MPLVLFGLGVLLIVLVVVAAVSAFSGLLVWIVRRG
jgi:hypothetical protein